MAAAVVLVAGVVAAATFSDDDGDDRRAAPTGTAPTSTSTSPSTSQPGDPVVRSPDDRPPGLRAARGYLATPGRLDEVARRAAAGQQPEAAAVADLMDFVAGRAFDEEPAPENPIDTDDTEGPLVDDTTNAYALALAYALTGDERYARRSGEILTAWVETATSTANTCPDDGSCDTSLILSRVAPAFVFAADLVGDVGLPGGRRAAFDAWLGDVVLPAASERENNWGDAGTFMRVVVTDWLGDERGFEAALDAWRDGMDRVAADGSLPEETRRGSSGIQYTQEALTYRVAVATLAARRGLDLWDHRGSEGAGLRDAVDYLARYWEAPDEWPHDGDVDVPDEGPMWEQAYAHWRDCAYGARVEAGRPFGRNGNSAIRWTTITDAAPVEECR